MRKYSCALFRTFSTFFFCNLEMTQAQNIVVITSCTSRKKKGGPVLALTNVDAAGSLSELALTWRDQVEAVGESSLQLAADLYGGRSMSEAKRAADILGAPLHIVSAGHGLLRADEGIPPYDVTVSPSPDNTLHRSLVRLGGTPTDWWQALIGAFGRQRSLGQLLSGAPQSLVLLAVPSVYLTLLAQELASLSDDSVKRLRIFTSSHGASTLPEHLQQAVIPYDDRLEGLAAFAGTRTDFPQRALRHFVDVLGGHSLPRDLACERVRNAMQTLRKPILPERQRKTDEEIVTLLSQNWNRFNGSATALLRFLRDEALVACEQSRFRTLRQRLLTDRNTRTGTHG